MSLYEQNRRAWDRMARAGHALATPATDDDLRNPLKRVDEIGWLGKSIRGQRVLCLGAGGGRHSALYTAAGAVVTVVDLSPGMLELDRQVAAERKFDVRLVEASMTSMPMLDDSEFDIVIQPVSTCYVDDLSAVYREVARVLRPGGLYISQHKQPMNLQASLEPSQGRYVVELPYLGNLAAAAPATPNRLRESGAREIIHSLQSLLGGMCRAGFSIEDLTEPSHGKLDQPPGSFGHRCAFIPPYLRVKARRNSNPEVPRPTASSLWLGIE
jgi:ubiquinone/menaquinone biosynthesis C-methylase UbiE